MKRKQGRNELCDCGSGLKYKKCCGASSGSRSAAEPPQSRTEDLHDSRYLLKLDWDEFVAEFSTRVHALTGKHIAPPVLAHGEASDAHYEDVVYVVPMIHRPTAGWDGVPDDVVAYVRESQEELVECLEDLAGRASIVLVAEGFSGPIDPAGYAAHARADAARFAKDADGYGIATFIVKNQHIPVVGGDIPEDLQALNEEILRASTRMPGARPVFNVFQEFRNRYGVHVGLRAARSLDRTPVLVFGVDHVEGIAYAAKRLGADVRITLVPTVAAQCGHLFEHGAAAARNV